MRLSPTERESRVLNAGSRYVDAIHKRTMVNKSFIRKTLRKFGIVYYG